MNSLEPVSRTPLILAAVGAWFASIYWAGLTLLVLTAVATGSTSFVNLVLPIILIGLYAVRGFQVFQGNRAAATGLLWLHAIGGGFALLQASRGSGLIVALQGFKLVIHLFGAVTAWRAQKALAGGL